MMMMTRTKLTRLVPFTYFPKCSLKTAANCGEKQSPERRRHVELPKELSKNVILLSCESTAMGCVSDVYVVGINKESNKQVEDIINFFKPEAVFLELCSSREHILYRDKIKVPTMQDMIAMWKKKHSIRGILYSWSMAKLAKEEDVYFGVEFRSAYREAKKYGGKVALGDRAHHITLKRTWRNLPLKHIIRLFDPSSYPEINFSDSLSFPAKVIEMLPTVKETIVHERDHVVIQDDIYVLDILVGGLVPSYNFRFCGFSSALGMTDSMISAYSVAATGSRCSSVYCRSTDPPDWRRRVKQFLMPTLVCFLGSLRVRWCFAVRMTEVAVFVTDIETSAGFALGKVQTLMLAVLEVNQWHSCGEAS
ncbi:hypothetical protein QL285_018752 [Trifolium repens]|nr:hypothetical protein QL285_018752 [Trifolium repens]